jgi:hypothetical protein
LAVSLNAIGPPENEEVTRLQGVAVGVGEGVTVGVGVGVGVAVGVGVGVGQAPLAEMVKLQPVIDPVSPLLTGTSSTI